MTTINELERPALERIAALGDTGLEPTDIAIAAITIARTALSTQRESRAPIDRDQVIRWAQECGFTTGEYNAGDDQGTKIPFVAFDGIQLLAALERFAGYASITSQGAIQAERASFERMFNAACSELGLINEHLQLDPNDGGCDPIIGAIEEIETDRDRLSAQNAELLSELEKAHTIIRNALNLMTIDQKLAWGEHNAKDDAEGEGVTRANERESAIRKAKETQ